MTITVPANLQNRSVFIAKISSVFEKMRVYSPISTIIRATAKTIDMPTLTVDDAKNHGIICQNSIGTATPGNSTISVDVKTDKSVDYCEDDFQDDKVGFKKLTKEEILKVIVRKLNLTFATNILAGATAVVGTEDLSTNALVNDFLTARAVEASDVYFSWKPRVEHGQVVRAKHQGVAYVMAGTTAYTRLLAASSSIKFQSIAQAQGDNNNMFISPQGVVVVNAGSDLSDLKQMTWGIGGAPVHAYRSDKIREWDEKISSRTTASATSGDVTIGDAVLERNFNMGAEVWNKPVVPAQLASNFKKRLMA